jgi:hypothetical protein
MRRRDIRGNEDWRSLQAPPLGIESLRYKIALTHSAVSPNSSIVTNAIDFPSGDKPPPDVNLVPGGGLMTQ